MSDHIQRLQQNTFTTTGCREIFNIQSGTLNSNSEKVHYLQRCKICDDTPYVGKAKTKFHLRFNNYKSKHQSFWEGKQNIPQKHFHSHYVEDLFEKCEMHKQLKERETFWQHKLKTFYSLGLNEKE